ncbi:MAG: U32 family peptidase [Clostridia bacterium]
MRSHLPELLCPAGDEEALRAAVDCGADAVYLGYKAFGARASAANFDADALKQAVEYAHLYHVRVHVTVNTLAKQQELSAVADALQAISKSGADAVIVQDLGIAEMVKRDFPLLALHASTQMALCNATGARLAAHLGFDRVVLARECSLADIQAVADTGVETEVFVHGALCSSVSGRCLMSSMAGGRSGNRGRCAQPCRQRLSLDKQGGALLSLKDLCLLDDLPALCNAGVSSLKIEGRLKSAEYVAVVTQAYRKALDAVADGSFQAGDAGVREALLQIFNRGGFTRGHAMGDEDAALCATERVGHDGLPMGTVTGVRSGFASVRLSRSLHDGDSLQIREREDVDLRYAGHAVREGEVATLRLRPDVHVTVGAPVARLCDAVQLEQARAHCKKPIAISMHAFFQADKPMRLCASDGISEACATGETIERAQKRASTAEEVRKQLSKLGDTPFTLQSPDDLTTELANDCFLPVGLLNALRRSATQKLMTLRVEAFHASGVKETGSRHANLQKQGISAPAPLEDGKAIIGADTLAVVFSEPDAANALRECGASLLVFQPRTMNAAALLQALSELPRGTWLQLPPQMSESTLQAAIKVIAEHEQHLGGVMVQSVGQLELPIQLPLLAGEGVPVTNREGMGALAKTRVQGFCLWPEWSKAEQQALLPHALPALLRVYGRETLMLLNHCPERVSRGLCQHRAQCALCTSEDMACGRENAALIDRKGYHFPLRRTAFPEGCVISVLNALPINLSAYEADRRALHAGMLLQFTDEPPERMCEITKAYAALMHGEEFSITFQATTGHWLRGAE